MRVESIELCIGSSSLTFISLFVDTSFSVVTSKFESSTAVTTGEINNKFKMNANKMNKYFNSDRLPSQGKNMFLVKFQKKLQEILGTLLK